MVAPSHQWFGDIPWKSKGILGGCQEMVDRTAAALWEASDHGRLPVVCDNSSCSEGLVHALETAVAEHPEFSSVRIIGAVDFAARNLLAHLDVEVACASMVVQRTCSRTRAGSNANLMRLVSAVA